MTDQNQADLKGAHRLIASIEHAVSELTVFATFVVIYLWFFALAHAFLGSRHWGWFIVGPVLVIPLLVLGSVLLEVQQEFLELPWIKTLLRLVALVRNVLAVGALLGLARFLSGLTDQEEPTTAAQVLQGLLLVLTGG